jgi:single-strand DNA-binding protein
MNLVVLQGNLVEDPSLREVGTSKVAKFRIAVTRYYKKKGASESTKDVQFFNCETWDTGAISAEKVLKKGDSVLVRGSLRNDSWEKDGQKHYMTVVRVEEFTKNYKGPKESAGEPEQEPIAAATGDDILF